MSKYVYKLLRSSWGIHIGLTAEALTTFTSGEETELTKNLAVRFNSTIPESSKSLLLEGFDLIKEDIQDRLDQKVLIEIQDIEFNPMDYQEEGLMICAMNWASREFDFPPPKIESEFKGRRYSFRVHTKAGIKSY